MAYRLLTDQQARRDAAKASVENQIVNHQTDNERRRHEPRTAAFLAIAMFVATIAAAQIKTVPGETITATATVTAIDAATRTAHAQEVRWRSDPGDGAAEVKRFAEIKVGDTITAKYTENMILRVMKPGEAAVNSATGGVAAGAGARPSGTVTAQRSVTATITAIDPRCRRLR